MAATNGDSTPFTTTTPAPAAAVATASQSPRSPSGIVKTAWSQVVRGAEPEPVVVVAPSSPPAANVAENPPEIGGDNNVVVSKKPAWNKKPMLSTPTSAAAALLSMNGEATETGGAAVVIGTEQWPSLSECTKASPKLSSSSGFSKNLPVSGSVPSPLVIGMDTSSTTSLVRSPSSTSQKPTTSNSNHHSGSNHGRASRQKSMKRDGGGNSQANGVLSHQSLQSAGEGSHHHHHHNNHGSAKTNSGSSSDIAAAGRDGVQNHSQRESGQRNASGEQPHQRNTFRRGNGGSHSRGDGSHQNYGGRRSEMERGNHDWNHQRSFNGRDAAPVQPRGGLSRGFMRVQPGAAPFVHPAPLMGPPPPFMTPPMDMNMGLFYLPPGVQFVPPVPSMFYPTLGPEVYPEIMTQIDYYFSKENLPKDAFLRSKMDENGWVSVDVIAQFNKVKKLTTETYQILEAVRPSVVVEVQGDKIRPREWKKWVPSPPNQNASDATSSGSQPPEGPAVSAATDHIQRVSLDEQSNNPSMVESQLDGNTAILHALSGDSSSSPQSRVDEASPGAC